MKLANHHKEYLESYSNLAYNIAGIVALLVYNDVLVCLAFQALGIASFTFHYHKTKPIYLFDWWGMAFINTVLAGYHFNSTTAWVLLIIWHVFYSYVLMGRNGVYIEVAMSSIISLIAIVYATGWLNGGCILAIFLIAIWIRSKDKDPKQAIFHDSIYHSAWHVLTAVGYYLAFYMNIN
jgi:hypothetical protein